MKRILALLLVLTLAFSSVQVASAATVEPVAPLYENATTVCVDLQITSTGKATITVCCIASDTSVSVQTTTYLERKDGASWVRVDNGEANNAWVYSTTSQTISKTYSLSLSQTGQYRAVTIFKLTGDTVERITRYSTATYGS